MSDALPTGWARAALSDVGTWRGGGTPATDNESFWKAGTIPWVSPKDMKSPRLRDSEDHITLDAVSQSATTLLPPGCVLVVTRSGILAHTLPVAVAEVGVAINQDLKGLHVCRGISGSYIAHAMRAYARDILTTCAKHGTTVHNIDFTRLLSFEIPIAPTREQARVDAAIEAQLSRLDSVVALLERVQRNLKRYRAAVLKAAVEGRLVPTEAELARREGRSFEPATALLARILSERRRRWEEAELARLTAKSRPPQDERWKSKYVEPAAPDTSTLPPLPDGWCWTHLGDITELKGGITKDSKRSRQPGTVEVLYLRVANVQRGYLDLTEMKRIAATPEQVDELRLVRGDVLFNEGGDRDKLGRGWIWQDELPLCIHQNHVFRARLFAREFEPKFVSSYGNANGQEYFVGHGKQTTNLASLNMTKLAALPVPVPPAAEQRRIVCEVDRLLSVANEVAAAVAAQLARCARLRQAILKAAFEGRLVDQDPKDEPASVLLERIRADRAARADAPRPLRRRVRRVRTEE